MGTSAEHRAGTIANSVTGVSMTDLSEDIRELEEELRELRHRLADLERERTESARTKVALQDALSRQTAILDNIPDMAWLKDKESRFLAVNESFALACGISKEELIGKTDFDFWPRELAERFRDDDVQVMQTGRRKVVEESTVHTRKEKVWIETIKSPIYNHKGEVVGTTGISRNITRRKKALEDLANSEEKYRELVQNAKSIILRFETSGRITFFNEFAQTFFGYTEEEVLGRSLLETIVPATDTSGRDVAGMIKELTADPDRFASNENENVCRNGRRVWVSWTNRGIVGQDGIVKEILSVGNDITELKRAEVKLRELATTDPLTGLFNRRQFWELGTREIGRSNRYGNPLSVVMLDIDHFKSVNDTYGHDEGDRVLQLLSRILRSQLRKVDIAGRLGGEEFAILLPNTSLPAARSLAERLRLEVETASLRTNGRILRFTVSIGVAEAESASTALEGLLKRADVALYCAKNLGRNRVEAAESLSFSGERH